MKMMFHQEKEKTEPQYGCVTGSLLQADVLERDFIFPTGETYFIFESHTFTYTYSLLRTYKRNPTHMSTSERRLSRQLEKSPLALHYRHIRPNIVEG
jgi:hypothetical protein